MSSDTGQTDTTLRYHIGGVVLAVPCRVPQNIYNIHLLDQFKVELRRVVLWVTTPTALSNPRQSLNFFDPPPQGSGLSSRLQNRYRSYRYWPTAYTG